MAKLRFERIPHFDTFMGLKSAMEFEKKLTKKSLYEWCRSFRFIHRSDLSYRDSNAKAMAKQLYEFRQEINRDAPVPEFVTPSIVSNLTDNQRTLWWRLWNARNKSDGSLISSLTDYVRDRYVREEEAPSGYPASLFEAVKFDSNPDEYVAPQSASNSDPGVNEEHDEDGSSESGDDDSDGSSSTVSEDDDKVCFCVASFHVFHNYWFFPKIFQNLS